MSRHIVNQLMTLDESKSVQVSQIVQSGDNISDSLVDSESGESQTLQEALNARPLSESFSGSVLSVSELKSLPLAGISEGEFVTVRGFYEGNIKPLGHVQPYGQGGGLFFLSSESTAPDDGGLVFDSNTPGYKWVRYFTGMANVHWWGTKGDGIQIETPRLNAAHRSGYNLHYPSGEYLIDGSIQVMAGQYWCGVKGERFPSLELKSTVRSTTSAPAFLQNESDSTEQESACRASDLEIISDEGIRLNDRDILVESGPTSPMPFLMKPVFTRVSFRARENGVGIGLSLTKCFDGKISECDFDRQLDCLILLGSDINVVSNNRFTSFYRYAILELATSTFGSQNLLENNDFVGSMSEDGVFIKTTGRHVRIRNNYLEQVGSPCKGFIDCSRQDTPVFGPNGMSPTSYFTVEIEENRIDGKPNATDFIYRYQGGSTYAKIHDVGTSGVPSSLPWLSIITRLPLFYGTTSNVCRYDIKCGSPGQGRDGALIRNLVSDGELLRGGDIVINNTNIIECNQLQRGDSDEDVAIDSDGIVLRSTLGESLFHIVLPERNGIPNVWLKDGVTYNVDIVARAESGSETLRVLRVVNNVSAGSSTETVVTNQGTHIGFTMVGRGAGDEVGIALLFDTPTPSTDIIVESIKFSPA